MTTITLSYRAIQNKVKLISLPKINWKLVYIFGILLCLLLAVFYIFSINKLTYGTYLIKNYNKEIIQLSKENKALEADFAKIGFLDQIHKEVKNLGFEKPSQIKYIEIINTSLAKAR